MEPAAKRQRLTIAKTFPAPVSVGGNRSSSASTVRNVPLSRPAPRSGASSAMTLRPLNTSGRKEGAGNDWAKSLKPIPKADDSTTARKPLTQSSTKGGKPAAKGSGKGETESYTSNLSKPALRRPSADSQPSATSARIVPRFSDKPGKGSATKFPAAKASMMSSNVGAAVPKVTSAPGKLNPITRASVSSSGKISNSGNEVGKGSKIGNSARAGDDSPESGAPKSFTPSKGAKAPGKPSGKAGKGTAADSDDDSADAPAPMLPGTRLGAGAGKPSAKATETRLGPGPAREVPRITGGIKGPNAKEDVLSSKVAAKPLAGRPSGTNKRACKLCGNNRMTEYWKQAETRECFCSICWEKLQAKEPSTLGLLLGLEDMRDIGVQLPIEVC